MTQNELEDAVMAYLAKDDGDNPRFQSLTTIFELLPEASQLTEAQHDDDEVEDKEQLRVALDQLAADGMVEARIGPREYEASYRITQDGFYQAVLGPDALIPKAPSGLFDPAIFDPAIFDTNVVAEAPSFASADWTGISAKLTAKDKAQIDELSASLQESIRQSDLDERTKRTALKHIVAVQTLLEAPDPPWRAIVDLLSHPALTAFLTAIQVLQLIWAAAN